METLFLSLYLLWAFMIAMMPKLYAKMHWAHFVALPVSLCITAFLVGEYVGFDAWWHYASFVAFLIFSTGVGSIFGKLWYKLNPDAGVIVK